VNECHCHGDDAHGEDVVGNPVGRLESGDIRSEAPGIKTGIRLGARSPAGD
jgi:hypothetical protein